MTLQVFTARLSCRDPDVLDITRSRADGPAPDTLGAIFAPSSAILGPALRAREIADELRRDANDLTAAPTGIERLALFAKAEQIESAAWAVYEPAYRLEMRQSLVKHRRLWQTLLERPRAVLTCFCVLEPGKPQRCHRRLLVGYLVAMGAEDKGEIE